MLTNPPTLPSPPPPVHTSPPTPLTSLSQGVPSFAISFTHTVTCPPVPFAPINEPSPRRFVSPFCFSTLLRSWKQSILSSYLFAKGWYLYPGSEVGLTLSFARDAQPETPQRLSCSPPPFPSPPASPPRIKRRSAFFDAPLGPPLPPYFGFPYAFFSPAAFAKASS